MDPLKFHTDINARPEKVWDILWNDATYPKWTAPFHEGSYAKSDWKEGSKIYFLIPSGDGMVSRIKELEEPRKMVFEHLGYVKNHEEQPSSAESKSWEGALESYTLTPTGTGTLLEVTLDADEKSAAYFGDAFPKALNVIKELSEQ